MKVTCTVQSVVTGAPQVLAVANGPVVWREEMINGPVPLLVMAW